MDVDKISGLVILYNPSQKEIDNIHVFIRTMKKFWIIDNSEHGLHDYKTYFAGIENIVIVQDGQNRGIGARINAVVEQASREGFQWLLTMDQDSTFTATHLTNYLHTISAIENSNGIAAVGVLYNTGTSESGRNISLKPVTHVITSGTAINIKATATIGLFNDELFIDEVDTEFCYRALVNGWKVMICEGVAMNHMLGETKMARSLITLKTSARSIHSPIRIYYMTRNFLWVRRLYKKHFPEVFKKRGSQLLNLYKNNLLYNSGRIKILKMILKGYRDYKRGKLGKLSVTN